MELYQLRCFIAVAEEMHFGRAAHKLEISPASLGRQIRMLEESLGARLLARTTRNVALTDDGTHLLAEARQILSGADKVAAHFRAERRDRSSILRVGAIDSAAGGWFLCCCMIFVRATPILLFNCLRTSRYD